MRHNNKVLAFGLGLTVMLGGCNIGTDIEVAVKKIFIDKYKTEVLVYNLIGNKNGVSVFVESVGEPHFHAVAIVPIDIDSNIIETEKVFTQAGQVEDALASGLYAMAYEEEIENLNNFIQQISKDNSLVGKNEDEGFPRCSYSLLMHDN